jgi:hypothetical protein
MRRIKQEDLIVAKTIHDVEPLPGQIIVVPKSNRMYEEASTPVDNALGWPEWFHNLEVADGSLKRCQGTQDFLSLGMTFRLPAEVQIRRNITGQGWDARWMTNEQGFSPENPQMSPDNLFEIQSFSFHQTGEIPATEDRKLKEANWVKIVNPWQLKTAPGWSCMVLPVYWEGRRNWTIMPGVVHTDFYHHVNWVLNIYEDEDFTIPYGQPIVHIIPFPRYPRTSVGYGDDSIHRLMRSRGMGTAYDPLVHSRKYRIAQRKADKECPYLAHLEQPKKRRFWPFRKS